MDVYYTYTAPHYENQEEMYDTVDLVKFNRPKKLLLTKPLQEAAMRQYQREKEAKKRKVGKENNFVILVKKF